jgi:hypothetical protein
VSDAVGESIGSDPAITDREFEPVLIDIDRSREQPQLAHLKSILQSILLHLLVCDGHRPQTTN